MKMRVATKAISLMLNTKAVDFPLHLLLKVLRMLKCILYIKSFTFPLDNI